MSSSKHCISPLSDDTTLDHIMMDIVNAYSEDTSQYSSGMDR
jgi:hypothetical protein